jgi:ribosomal protein S12 methylthiotransferase
MQRGIDRNKTYNLIKKLRNAIPDLALRTSLIVGFPGETEKEFNELIEFVEEIRFDRLGVFTYSHEEDTSTFIKFKDSVPDKIKKQRAAYLMNIQQKISLGLNEKKVGGIFNVIVDRREGDSFIARSEFDSPEVDNEIIINNHGNKITEGNFYKVKITSATEFDLFGIPV